MKAEYINPFIISVCKIMQDMCMLKLQIGKPEIQKGAYPVDHSIICLGLKGDLKGTVILDIEKSTALGIVSKMMMTPVNEIDAIGESAISELGNMIAGNAATVFANNGITIDITTPSYFQGSDFQNPCNGYFSIPFSSEVGNLSVQIQIEGA